MRRNWELLYPLIFAVLSTIPILIFKWDLSNVKNISSILNSGVTIGSIVIAFLATMISILITIANAEVMRRINKNDAEGDLITFIEITIVSGFFLAIYSMTLNIFIDLSGLASHVMLIAFVGVLTFFVFSAYRIIHIFSKILNDVIKESKPVVKKKEIFKPKINDTSHE